MRPSLSEIAIVNSITRAVTFEAKYTGKVKPKEWAVDPIRIQDKLGDVKTVKKQIVGQWVKFTGWPTYDYKHRSNSRNITATGNIWRATAWEVHPVTASKIVPAP